MPRKNVAPVAGRPLIAWSIEAALRSGVLTRVIVSTDDDEIADVSRKWGAEVPFMRPPELALDDSSHVSVVLHTLRWLETYEGFRPEYLMLLQPTSPLRTERDIVGAVRLAIEKQADSVVSVCETHHHPYLVKRIGDDGMLTDFVAGVPEPGDAAVRRQALPRAYFVNGAIYLIRTDRVLAEQKFLSGSSVAYIMPADRSLQIDHESERRLATLILENKHGHAAY